MSKKDYSCEHNSSKYKCKTCYPQAFCEHDKRRDVCKLCSGCIHGNMTYYCKLCKGGGICIHNIQKSLCKECQGSQICIHNHLRHTCKECQGNQICIHDKTINNCIKCNKNLFCKHGVVESYCKHCKGSQICIHNKRQYYCKLCKGGGICIHDTQKYLCKVCKGGGICMHEKRKNTCMICDPENYVLYLHKKANRKILKNLNRKKYKDYLGCEKDFFYNYIIEKNGSKNLENVVLRHVKSPSNFDLEDFRDTKRCLHYSNLIPIKIDVKKKQEYLKSLTVIKHIDGSYSKLNEIFEHDTEIINNVTNEKLTDAQIKEIIKKFKKKLGIKCEFIITKNHPDIFNVKDAIEKISDTDIFKKNIKNCDFFILTWGSYYISQLSLRN
jgi:hypothetical protein